MAHSNRLRVHWLLVIAEILLFVAAVVSAYLSEVNNWSWFVGVSALATIAFAIIKVLEAVPEAKDLLARDDMASKIALSAEQYGVQEYFNMQSAKDQALRNEATQQRIANAQSLWLCANSGASFLDPAIYRHWQFIERRLNDGVEFRVVLLDPYSKEKGFRNLLNVNGEQLDSKVNLVNLIKLHNKFPSLQIRFAKYGMHATVFATESCLFVDPYHVAIVGDRIENRSFSLLIEPATPSEGLGLYKLFKLHFDTLWRTSTSFEDWIIEVSDRLPSDLPKLKAR
ncbi:hypothetical protein A1353_10800 [Methylomonas methanica]|uniref:Uncharacterized protein n=1 Tax=Methylomonas methanica TaxID=421 RepID=A0A177MJY4_METMH|nr:hypothetical protein [Methylomonas methanica]OAI05655.1 hypothetical protein A1353_10800 [Methylomonas methanica]